MITFSHEKEVVKVKIETGICDWVTTAEMHRGSELNALLLMRQIDSEFNQRVEAFAKAMYEEGYRDGRGHKEKKSWFPSNLKFRF